MNINSKVVPLLEDLESVIQASFLLSNSYKRLLVEYDFEELWPVLYGEAENYFFGRFPNEEIVSKLTLQYLITTIYEQQRSILPNFIKDLLSIYVEETKNDVEITNIKKDLKAAKYSNNEIQLLNDIPSQKSDIVPEKVYNLSISNQNIQNKSKELTNGKKTPMLFISHSSKDKKFVRPLVSLLEGIGIKQDSLFCSSFREYGIDISNDIFETIRNIFYEHELFVIFVHSPRFYQSPISLNEMGAAWVLKTQFCSLLTKDMSYDAMNGVVTKNYVSIKVDDDDVKSSMNALYKRLKVFFSLKDLDLNFWERKRDDFLEIVNNIEYKKFEKDVTVKTSDFKIRQKYETAKPRIKNRVLVIADGDHKAKDEVVLFINKLHLQPIIFDNIPNSGFTQEDILEKNSAVDFAIFIYTSSEFGGKNSLQPRSNQSLVYKHGYLTSKLGRNKICVLCEEGVNLPSILYDVLYIPFEQSGTWKYNLAKEMKACGLEIDKNLIN